MASFCHVPLGLHRRSTSCPPGQHRGFGIALLLGIFLLITPVGAGAQSTTDPDLDSDGDGIANSHDPDDDNDGVTDDIDIAPFDPSIPGAPPTPNSIDPDADSDGDGIANSHDPDDDNDSIVDETDPAVFDPDNNPPGSSGGGSDSPGNAGTSSSGTSAQQAPTGSSTRSGTVLVTGLPKTGAGTDIVRNHGQQSMIAPTMLLLAFGSLLILLGTAFRHYSAPHQRLALVRRS